MTAPVTERAAEPTPLGAVAAARRPTRLTVISPAYNEAGNLPHLHRRLCEVLDPLELDWEWVVVDDHSRDATFEVAAELAQRDSRVRAVRLSRNCGAHLALSCGLHQARGDCAVLMAADLQDPPEVVPDLLARWLDGAQVVWAVRHRRPGESAATRGLSRLYYLLLRRVVGLKEVPATGADFLLLDRRVIDALRRFGEANVSVLALVGWMGFRQTTIGYDKQPRASGRSGWSLEKKLKLAIDSVTSFTYLPIRAMSYLGIALALLGFAYSLFVIIRALAGHGVQGWSSLMVVVLVLGGIQMIMMGVLGEYLWRALDESRRRPRYLIEAVTPEAAAGDPARGGEEIVDQVG